MSQDLTITRPRTITRQDAEAKIVALHGNLEAHPVLPNRFCVRSDTAATTTERQQLSAVRERLERQLEPCRQVEHVEVVVGRLLLGFDLARGFSDDDAADLRAEYVEAVSGLSLAAIHGAASRFRAGKTLTPWKRGFRPNPGELAEEARAGMVPVRLRLLQVRRVLEAELYDPPTEADRAKVATELARLTEDLRQRGLIALPRTQPRFALSPMISPPSVPQRSGPIWRRAARVGKPASRPNSSRWLRDGAEQPSRHLVP